jgi:hypothetical protein
MSISKIKTDSIADAAITSDKIATGGISTADLADGAITSDKIANDAISTAALVNGAVTDTKLATGSVENYFGTQGFALGMRNRIINGDMRIDQRNDGAAVTANAAYPVDRFQVSNGTDGAFSAQQDSSAPTGFIKSTKITITTADTSLTGAQALSLVQRIEGFNVADLGWGTANAQTVTLSFWVRSSLTGTFGGALRNSGGNRSYPFTYSILTADTWEYKTVTIVGDTSGTWLTDNNTGIILLFTLGAGPDRSGTAGAWNSNQNSSATGAVSVIGTLNATWYITGVQLEAGSVATPFERRPYGMELALCQRYYLIKTSIVNTSGQAFSNTIDYPVTVRALPTLITTFNAGTGATFAPGTLNFAQTANHSEIAMATTQVIAEL